MHICIWRILHGHSMCDVCKNIIAVDFIVSIGQRHKDQKIHAILQPIADPLVQMGIGKRVIDYESYLVHFHKK